MVRSIFADPLQLEGIEKTRANHLIIATRGLTSEIWQNLRKLGITLTLSFGSFDLEACPATPAAQEKLLFQLEEALKFEPEEIWLDHFRFDGHWEATDGNNIPDLHQSCEFCQGQDRVQVLAQIARKVMDNIAGRAKVGYFAVPFKTKEVPDLTEGLGQDHIALGKIFDMISPMIYHRMIKKSVSYISEYVRWLATETGKPILPIIQIKDMPDDLPDRMNEGDIRVAFREAIKEPSIGVCLFWWNHVLERNKAGIISQLFQQK